MSWRQTRCRWQEVVTPRSYKYILLVDVYQRRQETRYESIIWLMVGAAVWITTRFCYWGLDILSVDQLSFCSFASACRQIDDILIAASDPDDDGDVDNYRNHRGLSWAGVDSYLPCVSRRMCALGAPWLQPNYASRQGSRASAKCSQGMTSVNNSAKNHFVDSTAKNTWQ